MKQELGIHRRFSHRNSDSHCGHVWITGRLTASRTLSDDSGMHHLATILSIFVLLIPAGMSGSCCGGGQHSCCKSETSAADSSCCTKAAEPQPCPSCQAAAGESGHIEAEQSQCQCRTGGKQLPAPGTRWEYRTAASIPAARILLAERFEVSTDIGVLDHHRHQSQRLHAVCEVWLN